MSLFFLCWTMDNGYKSVILTLASFSAEMVGPYDIQLACILSKSKGNYEIWGRRWTRNCPPCCSNGWDG